MKVNDKELKDLIKKNIDIELDNISFSQKSKEEVIYRYKREESMFKRFLEYEISIPVKPLIAISAAMVISISYAIYPIVKIDENDVLSSKIEIVNLTARR